MVKKKMIYEKWQVYLLGQEKYIDMWIERDDVKHLKKKWKRYFIKKTNEITIRGDEDAKRISEQN